MWTVIPQQSQLNTQNPLILEPTDFGLVVAFLTKSRSTKGRKDGITRMGKAKGSRHSERYRPTAQGKIRTNFCQNTGVLRVHDHSESQAGKSRDDPQLRKQSGESAGG